MTSLVIQNYDEDEMDELMPSKKVTHSRPPNTMNTRAPTNIMTDSNLGSGNGNSGVDLNSPSAVSYDEAEGPDDESEENENEPMIIRPHNPSPPSSAAANEEVDELAPPDWITGSIHNKNKKNTPLTLPPDEIFGKKKMRPLDRPWAKKTTNDAEMEALFDGNDNKEDVDVVGVSATSGNGKNKTPPRRLVSPVNHDENANMIIDDDDDLSLDNEDDNLSYGTEGAGGSSTILNRIRESNKSQKTTNNNNNNKNKSTPPVENVEATSLLDMSIVDDNDVSPRWANNQSSPQEREYANSKALSLAAQRVADQTMIREEQQSQRKKHLLMQKARNSVSESKTPSSKDQQDRVRQEALMVLHLADHAEDSTSRLQKTETGGYRSHEGMKVPLPKTRTASYGQDNRFHIDDDDEEDYNHETASLTTDKTKQRSNRTKSREQSHMQEILIEEEGVPIDDQFHDDVVDTSSSRNKSSWGNRYSVDRHTRFLNGGLSQQQVLNRMDQENERGRKSAKGLFKTSPHYESANSRDVGSKHTNSTNGDVEQGGGGMEYGIGVRAYAAGIRAGSTVKTWAASMQSSMNDVMEKLKDRDNETHTTKGAHRTVNNSGSSPRQGIFTGISFLNISPRNSPTNDQGAGDGGAGTPSNRDGKSSWSTINLMGSQDLPTNMNFTGRDDYELDRRRKRKRCFLIVAVALLIIAITVGVLAGVLPGSKKNSNNSGTVPASYDKTVGESIQFYVTSDTPHNDADAVKLRRELGNIKPKDGDFLIHLGDVNLASITRCNIGVYRDAESILRTSPVPVLAIPGNNDWNDCPFPKDAFDNWMTYLNRFEEKFEPSTADSGNDGGPSSTTMPLVERPLAQDENFAFLHKGVLFFGLNLVNGKVQSEREWSLRHQRNLQWIEEQFHKKSKDDYRAIVMFGHSPPNANVGDFFWPAVTQLKDQKKPVLYMHANNGGGFLTYSPFSDLPSMTAVQMETGAKSAPVQVTIEFGPRPFTFSS